MLGLPTSGKTAYLVAVRYAIGRIGDWDILLDGGLQNLVEGLGFPKPNGRRRWERTAVGDIEQTRLFTCYPHIGSRVLRAVTPRFLRSGYPVVVPDVSGEVVKWAAEGASTDEDQEKADKLIELLAGCRGLVCVLDVTEEVSHQLEKLEVVLLNIRKKRRSTGRVPVALALGKCDVLFDEARDSRGKITLRVAESERYRYFAQRFGGDLKHQLERAGITVDGSGRQLSYSLGATKSSPCAIEEAAEGFDPHDPDAPAMQGWFNDPLHHRAVVRDFLRCHEKRLLDQISQLEQRTLYDIEPFLTSSWGGPPVTDPDQGHLPREDRDEVVPFGHEIRPIRILEPIRSILDRLYVSDVSRRFWRRVAAVSLVALLLLALGPGLLVLGGCVAKRNRETPDLDGARSVLETTEHHPLYRPVGSWGWVGIAEEWRELARALVDADRFEEALEAARKARELCDDEESRRLVDDLAIRQLRRWFGMALDDGPSASASATAAGADVFRALEAIRTDPMFRGALRALEAKEREALLGEGMDAALRRVFEDLRPLPARAGGEAAAADAFPEEQASSNRTRLVALLAALGDEELLEMAGEERWGAAKDRARFLSTLLELRPGAPDSFLGANYPPLFLRLVAEGRAVAAGGDPEYERRVDRVLERATRIGVSLEGLRLDVAEAGRNPSAETTKVRTFLQWKGQAVHPAVSRVVDGELEAHARNLWGALRRIVAGAGDRPPASVGAAPPGGAARPGGKESLTGYLDVLRELAEHGVAVPGEETEVSAAVTAFRLHTARQDISRLLFPDPAGLGETVEAADALLADTERRLAVKHGPGPRWDLRAELNGALDGCARALCDAFQRLDHADIEGWSETARLFASRDPCVRGLLRNSALFVEFAEQGGDGGVPAGPCRTLAGALEDEDLGRSGKRDLLLSIGKRLASRRSTFSSAFALVRCLERVAKESPDVDIAFLRSVTEGLRESLVAPPADVAPAPARLAELVEGLLDSWEESPDASADLAWLLRRARAADAPEHLVSPELPRRCVGLLAAEYESHADRIDRALLTELAIEGEALVTAAGESPGPFGDWADLFRPLGHVDPPLDRVILCVEIADEFTSVALARGSCDPTDEMQRAVDAVLPEEHLRFEDVPRALEATCGILVQAAGKLPNAFALRRAVAISKDTPASSRRILESLHERLGRLLLDERSWRASSDPELAALLEDHVRCLGEEGAAGSEFAKRELQALFRRALDEAAAPPPLAGNLQRICEEIVVCVEGSERELLLRDEVSEIHRRIVAQGPQAIGKSPFRRSVLDASRWLDVRDARRAIQSVVLQQWWLNDRDYEFIPIRHAGGLFFLTRDEVTLDQYRDLMRLKISRNGEPERPFLALLRIEFRDDVEIDPFIFSAGEDRPLFSEPYRRQVVDDEGKTRTEMGVFGPDPDHVSKCLEELGARLPKPGEWDAAYRPRGTVQAEAAARARTGDQLEAIGDVTEEGIRGMTAGLREWVRESSDTRPCQKGSSWFHIVVDRDPTECELLKSPSDRLYAGFRIALDAIPRQLDDYVNDYVTRAESQAPPPKEE